ncbi:MAG: hypothetical protein HYU66_22870 [Armatimonadetes bacterium]|nr:hypothetical protein [Armatimonadota bacterium]
MTGIAVNGRARALHFLHTCAWAGAEGTPAARYEVHYADGTRQVIPVRVGLEVADWYVDPHPLPLAEVAWRGHVDDKPGEIGLHMLRWANPWPDKPITDVSVVSAGGAPVAVLMALTVEP